MQVLTKESDYAIRALMTLGAAGDMYMSARDISDSQNIPYQFLRRILQALVREGLVESKEGSGGGVRIAVDPVGIKIVNVIEIFQGSIELSTCMFKGSICANRKTCVLRSEIKRIERMVADEFGRLTIRGLIDKLQNV